MDLVHVIQNAAMNVATDSTFLKVVHAVHRVALAANGGVFATLAWKPLAFLVQPLFATDGSRYRAGGRNAKFPTVFGLEAFANLLFGEIFCCVLYSSLTTGLLFWFLGKSQIRHFVERTK